MRAQPKFLNQRLLFALLLVKKTGRNKGIETFVFCFFNKITNSVSSVKTGKITKDVVFTHTHTCTANECSNTLNSILPDYRDTHKKKNKNRGVTLKTAFTETSQTRPTVSQTKQYDQRTFAFRREGGGGGGEGLGDACSRERMPCTEIIISWYHSCQPLISRDCCTYRVEIARYCGFSGIRAFILVLTRGVGHIPNIYV